MLTRADPPCRISKPRVRGLFITRALLPNKSNNNSRTKAQTGEPELTKNPNRLIHEKSPYLQQHAYNPVDWYPWGEEAFQEAQRRDVPVFLSIGYSTCHWCHVMERESFEDEETAEALNAAFVCVKVDREERPDIDAIYMTVCQMLTGGGGWPLTIILTPEKEPFWAGTYLPKTSRSGMLGLMDLIPRITQLWRSDRSTLVSDAASIVEALSHTATATEPTSLNTDTLNEAYTQLSSAYDDAKPRIRGRPQVPIPPQPPIPTEVLAEDENPTRNRHGHRNPQLHDQGRDTRPNRRRIPPILDGQHMAHPTLREDALRPGDTPPSLHRGIPGHRRPETRSHSAGHRRLHTQQPHLNRGSILLSRGRRQRGRRGKILHLDHERDSRSSSARRWQASPPESMASPRPATPWRARTPTSST